LLRALDPLQALFANHYLFFGVLVHRSLAADVSSAAMWQELLQ
jgi:hypothetical protein